MSRRMRCLIALYPRAWRERYGGEAAELTRQLIRAGDTTRCRAALNLATGAAVERARALGTVFAAAVASATATAAAISDRTASLVIRNLVFTAVVPGLGGAWLPWRILTNGGRAAAPQAWEAVAVIVPGIALYAWCVWNFAAAGRGTPGPWDAPKSVVAAGPYRFVRNPIYVAALLIVLGEAWLFMSPRLLAYAAAMALFFHLFVTCYEEPVLRHRFGSAYRDYRRAVPRWLVRLPRGA